MDEPRGVPFRGNRIIGEIVDEEKRITGLQDYRIIGGMSTLHVSVLRRNIGYILTVYKPF